MTVSSGLPHTLPHTHNGAAHLHRTALGLPQIEPAAFALQSEVSDENRSWTRRLRTKAARWCVECQSVHAATGQIVRITTEEGSGVVCLSQQQQLCQDVPRSASCAKKMPAASFLEVTVPDGVGPGDTIDVELLQGGKASLVLPASSHAGTVLTLTATGALVEPPGPTPERAKCKRCGEPGKPGYCQNPHCQQVSVPAKDSELGDLEPVGILGEVPRGASMRGRGQGRRYGPCEDCG